MAGELTYRRLLHWLEILKADDSPMLDLKVQVKQDETGKIMHTSCVMLGSDPPHQPYLLTCATPHKPLWEDEDTEDWDGPDSRPDNIRHRHH